MMTFKYPRHHSWFNFLHTLHLYYNIGHDQLYQMFANKMKHKLCVVLESGIWLSTILGRITTAFMAYNNSITNIDY